MLRKPLSCERVRINWEHPLNKELMSLRIFNAYGQSYDLVRKNLQIPVNGAYLHPQMGLVCNGANMGMDSGMVDLDLPKNGTFVMLFKNLGATGTAAYLLHSSTYGNFSVNYTSTGNYSFYTPDGHPTSVTGTNVADGNWHTLFVLWNDTTNLKQVIIDKYAYYASSTTYDFTMPPVTGAMLEISRLSSTYDAAGVFEYIALHKRELTPAEIIEYCKNPYGTPRNPRLIRF